MSALYQEIRTRYGNPYEFIKRVRAKMKLHGITQAALAKRGGFYPQHVSEWFGDRPGRRTPSMESMVVLDEALERLIQGE